MSEEPGVILPRGAGRSNGSTGQNCPERGGDRTKKIHFPQRGSLQASALGFVLKRHEPRAPGGTREQQRDGDSAYLRVLCAFVIREHGCRGERKEPGVRAGTRARLRSGLPRTEQPRQGKSEAGAEQP